MISFSVEITHRHSFPAGILVVKYSKVTVKWFVYKCKPQIANYYWFTTDFTLKILETVYEALFLILEFVPGSTGNTDFWSPICKHLHRKEDNSTVTDYFPWHFWIHKVIEGYLGNYLFQNITLWMNWAMIITGLWWWWSAMLMLHVWLGSPRPWGWSPRVMTVMVWRRILWVTGVVSPIRRVILWSIVWTTLKSKI